MAYLNEALKLDPKWAKAYAWRAVAYKNLEDYENAKLQRIKEDDVAGYEGRSFPHYFEAIEDCNKAIKLDPKCAAAYGLLGTIYEELGDNKRAILEYSKAISIARIARGCMPTASAPVLFGLLSMRNLPIQRKREKISKKR